MSERWKPNPGEAYYAFDSYGYVICEANDGRSWNEEQFELGNCFATKEEAKAALEKVKALLLSLHEPATECSQLVTDYNPLPKLTTEVFDRPDCPEWAKYAAVNADSSVRVFLNEPTHQYKMYWYDPTSCWEKLLKNSRYDSTDWKNSLIERPARLPDWCKVGEWVFDKAINKYSQVATEDVTEHLQEVCKSISKGEIVQARLRPYNSEEMKALVGNTIEYDSHVCLVIGYNGNKNTIFIANGSELCVQTLMSYYNVNGKPAGVFEHLENGEWVE